MPQVSQVYKPIERIELILLWVILLLITYQLISYYFNNHGQSSGISQSTFFDMIQCKCKKRSQWIVKIIEFHQVINRVHNEKTLGIDLFSKSFITSTSLISYENISPLSYSRQNEPGVVLIDSLKCIEYLETALLFFSQKIDLFTGIFEKL